MTITGIIDFAQVLTEAERYRPAAEKILKGEPDQAVYNHYSSPCGQFAAGVWEGEVGQWTHAGAVCSGGQHTAFGDILHRFGIWIRPCGRRT